MIDGLCDTHEEIPRISLSFCPIPGEMDYFYTYTFKLQYGSITAWHCRECKSELFCGIHSNSPAGC